MEIKKNKLVITEKEGVICYGYFQDGVPTELYCEPKEAFLATFMLPVLNVLPKGFTVHF